MPNKYLLESSKPPSDKGKTAEQIARMIRLHLEYINFNRDVFASNSKDKAGEFDLTELSEQIIGYKIVVKGIYSIEYTHPGFKIIFQQDKQAAATIIGFTNTLQEAEDRIIDEAIQLYVKTFKKKQKEISTQKKNFHKALKTSTEIG